MNREFMRALIEVFVALERAIHEAELLRRSGAHSPEIAALNQARQLIQSLFYSYLSPR